MADRIWMIVLRLWWYVFWILSVKVSRINMSSMRTRDSTWSFSTIIFLAIFLLISLDFLPGLALEATLSELSLSSFSIPLSNRMSKPFETSWSIEIMAWWNLISYLVVHSVRIVHVSWCQVEALLMDEMRTT